MENLLNFLETPKPFQTVENNLWKNERVSDFIFDAHFNNNVYGGSKDEVFIEQAVQFIHSIIYSNSSKSVLDLGCGPGLYSLRIAAKGLDVVGVDFSSRSIEYANKHNFFQNLRYFENDILHFKMNERFDFCLLLFRIYNTFSENDRKRLLQNIRQHLNTDGYFLLDVPSEQLFSLENNLNIWNYDLDFKYSSEKWAHLYSKIIYPNKLVLNRSIYIFNDKQLLFYDWVQFFSVSEIKKELINSGFKIVSVYNDINGGDFTSSSENIAVLCQKI